MVNRRGWIALVHDLSPQAGDASRQMIREVIRRSPHDASHECTRPSLKSASPSAIPQVHERLQRQGNLSTLNSGFQQIAHIETDLLADDSRDDRLIFALYGDECHGYFSFRTTLLNRSSAAYPVASGPALVQLR
jgi:hypothetical protein